MIKTILVPATGDPSDAAALAAALAIARAFSAHIDMLHVRIDPVDAALAASVDPGGALIASLTDRMRREAAQREADVKQLFDSFCEREGLTVCDVQSAGQSPAASAQWHVQGDDSDRTVAAFGRSSDLILAMRGVEHDVTNRSIIEAALLETGRPLLIPGRSGPAAIIGGTAAIAWKAVPHAARAVAAAMPLLARAAEIVVMTVDEGNGAEGADRLIRNLARHGLRARTELLRSAGGNAADTLLAAAAQRAALLVMGAYGHSRVREWVFGGFTRRVLDDAPLPVLLAH